MKPFVKWAGGKRQILEKITGYVHDSITTNPENDQESTPENTDYTYIEPFLGGGAVFFSLQPKKAIINDLNEDLINAYRVIQSDKYEALINRLRLFSEAYHQDADGTYYDTRGWEPFDLRRS